MNLGVDAGVQRPGAVEDFCEPFRPVSLRGWRWRAFWVGLVLLPLLVIRAQAHWSSDSYLTLQVTNGMVLVRWEIALRDLDLVLGLDENGDGSISEAERIKKEDEILLHGAGHLGVRLDDLVAGMDPGKVTVAEHLDGGYAVLPFTIRCFREPEVLEIDYRLHDGLDPHHRGLVQVISGEKVQTAVVDKLEPQQRFVLATPSKSGEFLDFLRKGIWHIWIGVDHLLFLLALLLPSVLRRLQGRWEPVGAGREAFWKVVKVITSFTVAHSITLTLAAMDWVRLPGRLVESVIAFSVAVAALNNLRPMVLERGWAIAFGFGLIHGFGFASVLGEFGLAPSAKVLALVGFNAGVEVGQLACVVVFFPIAFVLRKTFLYKRILLGGGSVLILVLALIWAVERGLGQKWLPF